MKKLLLIFFLIVELPFHVSADTIFFKNGSKTVCREKAWEEKGKVMCEFYGTVVAYPLKNVLRIEKNQENGINNNAEKTDKQIDRSVKQKINSSDINNGNKKKPGILFYNPRRTHKYRADKDSYHDTLNDAVKALSVIYKKPPVWIKKHMGSTNNLTEMHKNLVADFEKKILNTPSAKTDDKKHELPELSEETLNYAGLTGIVFYNPRRTQKYWVSKDSRYDTLNDAVKAFSAIYKKPPAWIKKHMDSTNNLTEIHRSLSGALSSGEL